MIRSAYDRFLVNRGAGIGLGLGLGIGSPSAVAPYPRGATGTGTGAGAGAGAVAGASPRLSTRGGNNNSGGNNNLGGARVSSRIPPSGTIPGPASQQTPIPTLIPGQGPGQGSADDLRRPSGASFTGPRHGRGFPFPMTHAASTRSRGSQDTFGLTEDYVGMLLSTYCPCSCLDLLAYPSAMCPLATKCCKGHYNLNKKFRMLRTSLFFLVFYLVLWMTLLGYKGTHKHCCLIVILS